MLQTTHPKYCQVSLVTGFYLFFELAGGVGIEEAVAFEQLLATLKGLPFLQPLLTEKHSQGAQQEVLGEGGTSVKVRGNL